MPTLQVLKLKPALWSFILQPEESDEEHFQDIAEDGEDDTPKPRSPPAHTSQGPVVTHLGTPPRTVDNRAEAVPNQEEPMAALTSAIEQTGEGDEGAAVLNEGAAVSSEGGRKGPQYKAPGRNPLYCGAEYTCLWELGRVSSFVVKAC